MTTRILYFLILSGFFVSPQSAIGQDEQAFFIKNIYNTTLNKGKSYDWLYHLSENIGGRLAGSANADIAVDYTYKLMQSLDMDTVWKQPCMVPVWERGDKEEVCIKWNSPKGKKKQQLNVLSLGNTIGTGKKGVKGDIIEVFSLDTLDKMDPAMLEGKVVFFNRPMDPSQIRTFNAYGGAVDQRVFGAARAAKHGAIAVLVRSVTLRQDDNPHTGVSQYEDGIKKIPSLAISTNDANQLSQLLKQGKVEAHVTNNPQVLPEKESYNVVGEIRGSEHPEKIILVGGHLDSWDVGGGAHDDGAGCVHALEVINVLKMLDYKPRHTIRCVLFMNEENGLGGGKAYAKISNDKEEFHLAAVESDAGGFTPRGFSCTAEDEVFKEYFTSFREFGDFLSPYDLSLKAGGAGADINPLKSQKGLLIGFRPDSQRYFDYHHTSIDRIEAVNPRELKMGAAAITSLVYLIDQYGL